MRKQKAIARKAMARALTRGVRTMRTEASREVAKQAGIKVRDVKKATTVSRATTTNLQAELSARGRPLNLKNFNARAVGRGPSRGVSAKAWGRRRRYVGMWLGNDGRTAFIRSRRKGRVRGAYGPGVAKSVLELVQSPRFRSRLSSRLTTEFRSSYDFQLKKAGLR